MISNEITKEESKLTIKGILEFLFELEKELSFDFTSNYIYKEGVNIKTEQPILNETESSKAERRICELLQRQKEIRGSLCNVLIIIYTLIMFNISDLPVHLSSNLDRTTKAQTLFLLGEALEDLAQTIRQTAKRLYPETKDMITRRAVK
ncbi:MAG: hypothetical protein ACREOW_10505 [Thermodesulfobacteriota bacterium]